MVFRSIVPSHLGSLSPQQSLQLTYVYLECASKTKNHDIALVLCHDAEVTLSQARNGTKKPPLLPKDTGDQAVRRGIAAAYIDLGKLLANRGYSNEAQASYKKAEKWGGHAQDPGRLPLSSLDSTHSDKGSANVTADTLAITPSPLHLATSQNRQRTNIAMIPSHIFMENLRPAAIEFKLPEADERLSSTSQLACCLGLLKASYSPDTVLESTSRNWLQAIKKDTDEQERLKLLATEVVRAFKRDELKDAKAVAEVVYLAPVLDNDTFRDLLREFYSGIENSGLLDVYQLEGLARLMQGADLGYFHADDLVKILDLLSTRLRDTHQRSPQHVYQLTLTVSHVLDAMADTNVKDLDREKLHEPLSAYLEELKSSSDPYLVYQAAYAYQALLCVPDNETLWQATMRRTGKVVRGVSGLVSAVKCLDFNKFMDGLEDIQQGLAGVSQVAGLARTTYEDVTSLAKSGQDFMKCLKEGLSFHRRREWYSALRGADILIRDGELATFKKLVCEAPCRHDPAFQWGVCERLGEIAGNPIWSEDTRQSAVEFLGEIYQNDSVWGQQLNVKQWIISVLMQLSSSSTDALQLHVATAQRLLGDLETNGDAIKQAQYRACREKGMASHPIRVSLPTLGSPSLLDRVQNRPDVEGNLRILRKQRLKERSNAVYIPPQAKASLQTPDHARFPLMERVKEFLSSDQKVFLVLGDSGAGKSTFSRELELDLWQAYKNKTGRIPLRINLPAIDKSEHDMIPKQLRKAEFTEPQIREMKHYRKFVLVCDGYDESQQTHNLYRSNKLNQPGEWDAQMVISCRSEYLGVDYQDRFRPGDRNRRSDSALFQEAVITPFSFDQVQAYIKQYVTLRQPLWQTEDYKRALDLIPSLKDLVKNPFLMTLSLEVLPRMVDSDQQFSTTRITRVALYDQFVEQWLERGKKRLGEKDLGPQGRAAFENLSDEGFTQSGIYFMKRLAMAIYKEQGGQPVVEYSRLKDEGSWKDVFFSREDEKRLLREACPLVRSGNQHRFIHRSLLEYGLSRAIFDPHDVKKKVGPDSFMPRRGSVSSTLSFEIHESAKEELAANDQEPDFSSPLVWRNLVNDHSLLQFLEERVQQEPVFKQQLFAYIEHSKRDKKWRVAAANAMTILVRAGVQFIGVDLRGIQIPGADLSYGMFDSTQLQGVDLRKANLRGLWLRQADVSSAQMTGAQFGELPSLIEESAVRSCSYSPDGKLLAVGLSSGLVNLYTTLDWEPVRALVGHSESVRAVTFSPTGLQIASSSDDKSVKLWDVGTGSCQRTLTGHSNKVQSVAYSPQGDMAVSAGSDKTIRLWNVETGTCRYVLTGHNGAVSSAVYSPNGKQIASGGGDRTVRLWDAETRVCSLVLQGHSGKVWSVTFSPSGNLLASASDDKTVRLWTVESGTCRHVLTNHSHSVFCVVFSPKADQLVSVGKDGTGLIWDVETGACHRTLAGHTNSVTSAMFSPRGDQVASGSLDKTVRLWDVEAGTSRYAASGHRVVVRGVKCSPAGDQVASCSVDGTIKLWDAETGSCSQTLRGHSGTIFGIAYSPQGDQIASGSTDKTVRLWGAGNGDPQCTLSGHNDWVNCVAYSPSEDLLVSCSKDRTMRLWDLETRECRKNLTGHTDGVTSAVFSPKGCQIVSGGADFTVRLWDVETGVCQQTMSGHSDIVWSVAFSPGGRQVVSASEDSTVRLWDVESGAIQQILTGHTQGVSSVAPSVQGTLVASGSWDKTVRLWDVESGQCRGVIQDFQDCIYGIDWRTDPGAGSYLVTGCRDGSVLMWQVVEEADQCSTRMCWGSTNGTLTVSGACIQHVHGLSQLNMQLLEQRGALGEPLLRQAAKKLITMASVVSRLKQSSDTVTPPTLADNDSDEQELGDSPPDMRL